MGDHLKAALRSVDWTGNVEHLCLDDAIAGRIERCNMVLALWASQIENIEKNNPAMPFLREMQRGGHDVASCMALGLYKPAASSMRSLLECALYYTYFRVHPAELRSLILDEKYYVTKSDIVEFFKAHVPDYKSRQSSLNFGDRLESWYSVTSAVVHGQLPGLWAPVSGSGLKDVKHNESLLEIVVTHFETAVKIVSDLFLCVLAQEIWAFIDSGAKKELISGMPGHAKSTLKLDMA
ncbi:hypothetical protein QF205_07060 [Luteimonas composti]|uniref:Uncharacterized protein n=1 Tax=Luteimonas composti TaxID=398257 RepID=A0ABT6MQD2_9GAMM|nr:hypothetical protein [Luteimonas composti]MDH7452841.1 hypothetical protein [Luteimonas composti]